MIQELTSKKERIGVLMNSWVRNLNRLGLSISYKLYVARPRGEGSHADSKLERVVSMENAK